LAATTFELPDQRSLPTITMSLGVAALHLDDTYARLLERADAPPSSGRNGWEEIAPSSRTQLRSDRGTESRTLRRGSRHGTLDPRQGAGSRWPDESGGVQIHLDDGAMLRNRRRDGTLSRGLTFLAWLPRNQRATSCPLNAPARSRRLRLRGRPGTHGGGRGYPYSYDMFRKPHADFEESLDEGGPESRRCSGQGGAAPSVLRPGLTPGFAASPQIGAGRVHHAGRPGRASDCRRTRDRSHSRAIPKP
jgi:hypothetical protein